MFGRRARSFIEQGTVLKDAAGNKVTTLDTSDNTYFRDDNMTAWSVKFVYYLK